MTTAWSENTPSFSGDGKWLYFTTARQRSYPKDYKEQRYNLCRVAFDERTGQMGQKVDTLIHADAMQKSVTWPRVSYDDRFVMYTLIGRGEQSALRESASVVSQ